MQLLRKQYLNQDFVVNFSAIINKSKRVSPHENKKTT